MNALMMAALGALAGIGFLGAVASLRGVHLWGVRATRSMPWANRIERPTLWLSAALLAALVVWAVTRWPVAAAWIFFGVLAIPVMRGPRRSTHNEIERVEAIATWTEQIRDTMRASAGLQQALVATASHGPAPIETELLAFARRAPRGELAAALEQLGQDLDHPSGDLVVAGLIAATELDAGRLVPLLSRLAASIRDEARMRIRIEVGRARVRTSMVIVAASVGLTVVLLLIVGSDLLTGYRSAEGQVWLAVVGGVVATAVWASRKLGEIPQPDRFIARRVAS